MTTAIFIVVALRIVVPISIFRWRLSGALASMILDALDADFLLPESVREFLSVRCCGRKVLPEADAKEYEATGAGASLHTEVRSGVAIALSAGATVELVQGSGLALVMSVDAGWGIR